MTLDYRSLRKKGLENIELYSSNEWTDYNSHDPGITILEYLCYVLSDVSLRTERPVADFLAVAIPHKKEIRFGKGRPLELLHNDSDETALFHYAEDVLPCQPLTSGDFRKIIIDIDGVQNACLKPVSRVISIQAGEGSARQVTMKGLSDVAVRFDPGVDPSRKEKIIKSLKKHLSAHRNLCEDFADIREAGLEDVYLQVVLALDDDVDREEVTAQCAFALEQYITPHIAFYSLEEMQKRGKTLAEIFTGPRLLHGFVDDEELQEASRTTLVKSEICTMLQSIPGVLRVKKLILAGQSGFSLAHDLDVLELGEEASFFQQKQFQCTCWQKGREYLMDEEAGSINDIIRQLRAKNNGQPKLRQELSLPIAKGDGQGILEYPSLQHHFPLCYGIGPEGMPEAADNERQSQAKQLKGYLLFFEQFAADYLAQLAHIKELFYMGSCEHTYYSQVIRDCPGVEDLIGAPDDFGKKLKDSAESENVFLKRRNCFLDHLLARFAESMKFSDLGNPSGQTSLDSQHLIIAKQAFLKNYVAISSTRGGAADFSRPISANNMSGLERRVRFSLGMDGRDLGELFIRTSETNTFDNKIEYRFYLRGPEEKIYLSSKDHFYSNQEMTKTMNNVRAFGQDVKKFQIKLVDNDEEREEFSFILVDDNDQILAEHPNSYEDENACQDAISEVFDYLSLYTTREPLYIVEHLLLRPEEGDTGRIHLAQQGAKSPADSYSFQISTILPKASKFYEQKAYVENVISESTPAHILPHFVWLDETQMEEFEYRYFDWAQNYAVQSKGVQGAASTLVGFLNSVRAS